MRLSPSSKQTIATAFGIAKSGPTHVANNEIVSDGFKPQDIENALTLPALQTYLNTTETDHTVLWTRLVDKTEGREVAAPPEPEKEEREPMGKKRGRPRKVLA